MRSWLRYADKQVSQIKRFGKTSSSISDQISWLEATEAGAYHAQYGNALFAGGVLGEPASVPLIGGTGAKRPAKKPANFGRGAKRPAKIPANFGRGAKRPGMQLRRPQAAFSEMFISVRRSVLGPQGRWGSRPSTPARSFAPGPRMNAEPVENACGHGSVMPISRYRK